MTLLRLFTPLLTLMLAVGLLPGAAHAAGSNLIVNPRFEEFGATAPTGWSTWTPAGAATYTASVGPQAGTPAVLITTGSHGSRGFLFQDVTLPADAGAVDLSFWQHTAITGGSGRAAVRVQIDGQVLFFGEGATSGWREVTERIDVPDGVTTLRIELMVDFLQAEMTIAEMGLSVSHGDLIVNGGFEEFTGALPTSWSQWAPSGTGSVSRIDGRQGQNALALTTDTPTSRLALTQDVTLPDGGGRYDLGFMVRRSAMSGNGQAGIRINYLDGSAAGGAVFIGDATETTGWVTEQRTVQIPDGTTTIRVHLFNDGVQGTMELDAVTLTRAVNQNGLVAGISPAGDVALHWTTELTDVDHYDIYRGAADGVADTLVRTVDGRLTRATDHSWAAATSYRYLVVGVAADGTELMRTDQATVTAPATDPVTTASIALAEGEGDVHMSWRAPTAATLPLRVVSSDGSVLAADLAATGGLDLATDATFVTLVDGGGRELATATRAALTHPRLGLDAETLDRTRRIITQGGTPQQAWETVLARVDAGLDAFTSTPDRYAREAAFVYQVTGDQQYADLAYDAMLTAIEATPLTGDKELEVANPVSSIALVYDWAYPGWTEHQRRTALDYFALTADHFQFGDSPNIVLPDKASNWVGVVRGAELAQHLAARGDGDYGWQDARLGQLLDEVDRHLRASITDLGWFQEGLDYLDYTAMISTPGIQGSFDQGIDALRESWFGPATTDLILHSVALTSTPSRLQWGVGESAGSISFPLYLDRVPAEDMSTYLDLFERVQGHRAASPWYSPGYVTTLFTEWPQEVPAAGTTGTTAMIDTTAGAATFRDRIHGADDVLLTLNSRNHQHLGWSGYDSFGVSLIGYDTVWARQPGKSQSTSALYSRVLVDDQAVQHTGHGVTTASALYDGQGGGYVAFDAAGNLGVDAATRQAVTDFSGVPTLAISDRFSDDTSHAWTWQLVPQSGVTAQIDEVVDGVQEFTLWNGDAWLHGVLLNAEGATTTFTDGVFRITREAVTEARFDLVLTLGRGQRTNLITDGMSVTVGAASYDLTALAEYVPTAPGTGGTEEPGTGDPGEDDTGGSGEEGTDDTGSEPDGSGGVPIGTTAASGFPDDLALPQTGTSPAQVTLTVLGLFMVGTASILLSRRRVTTSGSPRAPRR